MSEVTFHLSQVEGMRGIGEAKLEFSEEKNMYNRSNKGFIVEPYS